MSFPCYWRYLHLCTCRTGTGIYARVCVCVCVLVLTYMYIYVVYTYSQTSDNGHSEKRKISLQRTSSVLRIEITIVVILKQPPRSGRFSIPDSGQDSNSQRDFLIQNCL